MEALLPVVPPSDISQATVQAAHLNNVRLLLRLIEAGGDANSVNEGGDSLLLWAAEHKQVSLTTTLLGAGALPNLSNHDGFTPLMFAGWKGNVAIINKLVAKGADLNAQNKYGSTALMWAIEGHQYDAVRTLILAGADLTLKNHEKKSAMDWAIAERDKRMCNLLYLGRIHQYYKQIKISTIDEAKRLVILQKAEKISKSEIVNYMLKYEGGNDNKLDFLQQAIAIDQNGKPSHGLSQFLHMSQGLGFRKFFSGEASCAVSRIKSEIRKIQQEKAKSAVDTSPKFR